MQPTIKLVRHGQSQANVDRQVWKTLGDFAIPLTPEGRRQAQEAGKTVGGPQFIEGALIYTSPYVRSVQTLGEMFEGAGLPPPSRPYADPRLREVDHGYDHEDQDSLRRQHGWFYYRFKGGESPADCYDRTSTFLESMMRQVDRKDAERVLIVTHGLTIRAFVMRFLHLSVDDFDRMANPGNCDVITLASRDSAPNPDYAGGRWGCWGLRRRTEPR